jgi:prepilin-type processing-associated H-X9-DG protein
VAQCRNNVMQLALGCLHHENAIRRLPTDGWGAWWTGDADLGTAPQQPGGWLYNVLPYIEQQAMHDMGARMPTAQKNAANAQRYAIPLSVFYCPTRRRVIAYPWVVAEAVVNCSPTTPVVASRSDYAINGGDVYTAPGRVGENGPITTYWAGNFIGGPDSLADGGVAPCSPQQAALARQQFAWIAQGATGVGYCGSLIKLSDITDGTSQTYLLGERQICPDHYLNGEDSGDNEGAMMGDDDDIARWTAGYGASFLPGDYLQPMQDMPGYVQLCIFGSAHATGFNVALCDGSVRTINYSIDPETHRRLGNRKDGLLIDAKKW